MTSVAIENLSVKYGDFYAVKNISFTVEEGEIFGFLGANGAGKTTTIRVLCGLLIPSEGQAVVGGVNVESDPFAVKKKVGYMSQKFTLYDDMTVAENLSFAASLRKLDDGFFKEQKKRLLDFIHFAQSTDSLVRDLPGGIKQQVSLIASLLHDPEIVFLDEPTAGVSPAFRQRFWELIRQLADARKTVFVTTHYMDEAEQCGRIALMRDGELIALDAVDNLKMDSFPNKKPKDVHLEDVFINIVEGTKHD
ncbi:MAG TPA: ABC transporter ATP-binding protein [Bdellovibrio sp.]|uniref:ABC transporter ATP-binding protein n=1 Tax=Bdellovibrio sp. TaxID=28201 RepID=UPI002F21242E